MTTKKLIFFFFNFIFFHLTQAQNIIPFDPTSIGLDKEKLETINQTLTEYVNKNEMAGCVALIARKGKVGYFESFGMKDKEANQAMKKETIFRIASMTKPITVAAIMMLYEEGYFSLDDSIGKFIPELSNLDVMVLDSDKKSYQLKKTKSPITIRHLLTHTSGFTYNFSQEPFISDLYVKNRIYNGLGITKGTIGEMIQRLSTIPLVHQPGEKWHYGMSMDVLGHLIEKVSKKPLDVFFKEKIFDPLGMNNTCFYLPKEKVSRLAALYNKNSSGKLKRVKEKKENKHAFYTDYPYNGLHNYFSGGAGLVSTTEDYYLFLQMLLNNGVHNNKQIISKKSIELMTSEQTGNKSNTLKGYGFGFGYFISRGSDETGTEESKGQYLGGGFFNTLFWVDPQQELIGVIMMQLRTDNREIKMNFKKLAYQAIIN